jgi:hypothetical protein
VCQGPGGRLVPGAAIRHDIVNFHLCNSGEDILSRAYVKQPASLVLLESGHADTCDTEVSSRCGISGPTAHTAIYHSSLQL